MEQAQTGRRSVAVVLIVGQVLAVLCGTAAALLYAAVLALVTGEAGVVPLVLIFALPVGAVLGFFFGLVTTTAAAWGRATRLPLIGVSTTAVGSVLVYLRLFGVDGEPGEWVVFLLGPLLSGSLGAAVHGLLLSRTWTEPKVD